MNTVNYFIIGEIFGLLERIELIQGVDFSQFDPDDAVDVRKITEEFIKPTVEQSSIESQEAIRLSIAYYTSIKKAPFQIMKDKCQDLMMADAKSWDDFLVQVGITLFGNEFKANFDADKLTERLNEQESELIFRLS